MTFWAGRGLPRAPVYKQSFVDVKPDAYYYKLCCGLWRIRSLPVLAPPSSPRMGVHQRADHDLYPRAAGPPASAAAVLSVM